MKVTGFRVRITIQKNVTETDRYGNHKSVWTDHFSCWSSATEQSGDESEEASRTREKATSATRFSACSFRISADARTKAVSALPSRAYSIFRV